MRIPDNVQSVINEIVRSFNRPVEIKLDRDLHDDEQVIRLWLSLVDGGPKLCILQLVRAAVVDLRTQQQVSDKWLAAPVRYTPMRKYERFLPAYYEPLDSAVSLAKFGAAFQLQSFGQRLTHSQNDRFDALCALSLRDLRDLAWHARLGKDNIKHLKKMDLVGLLLEIELCAMDAHSTALRSVERLAAISDSLRIDCNAYMGRRVCSIPRRTATGYRGR